MDKYEVPPMPTEHEGHTCIYIIDDDDRNFKYCIYCERIEYRTDEEIAKDYGIQLERRLRGISDDDGA